PPHPNSRPAWAISSTTSTGMRRRRRFGVTRDEARSARFPGPVSPLPNGLAVQAEPRRRRLEAMNRGILENRQASLHLPSVPTADRPVDHRWAPFLGLGVSQPSRGPIPKEILQGSGGHKAAQHASP